MKLVRGSRSIKSGSGTLKGIYEKGMMTTTNNLVREKGLSKPLNPFS
jgi:hypothetical protein